MAALFQHAEVAVNNPQPVSYRQVAALQAHDAAPRLWEVQIWPMNFGVYATPTVPAADANALDNVVVMLSIDESQINNGAGRASGQQLELTARGARMQLIAQSINLNVQIANLTLGALATTLRVAARITPAPPLPPRSPQTFTLRPTAGIQLPRYSTEYRLRGSPARLYSLNQADGSAVLNYTSIPLIDAWQWQVLPPTASSLSLDTHAVDNQNAILETR